MTRPGRHGVELLAEWKKIVRVPNCWRSTGTSARRDPASDLEIVGVDRRPARGPSCLVSASSVPARAIAETLTSLTDDVVSVHLAENDLKFGLHTHGTALAGRAFQFSNSRP